MKDAENALGNLREVLWKIGRAESFSIQWTLMVSARARRAHVESALARLQAKHALLRSTIIENSPMRYRPSRAAIPLIRHQRRTVSSWRPIALRALAKPLAESHPESPFLRVDWVAGSTEHEFIFTADHGSSDLRSLTGLGCDFLRFLDEALTRSAASIERSYPLLPPTESLLPLGKPSARPEAADTIGDDAPLANNPPYSYRHPHVIRLSKRDTSELLAAAHRRRQSVHAILTASMILAVGRHFVKVGNREPTFCATAADIRRYLVESVDAEQLGYFVAPIAHPFSPAERLTFSNIASAVDREIREAFATDLLTTQIKRLASLQDFFPTPLAMARVVKVRESCALVSNVGVVRVPELSKRIRLRKTQFGAASPMSSGRSNVFWLRAATVQGRLQLEFLRTYSDGPDAVPSVAARFMTVMKRAGVLKRWRDEH